MKTVRGWNDFRADAAREPILVPLLNKTPTKVEYPTRRKIKQIFDKDGNIHFDAAAVALFGDAMGKKLVAAAEDAPPGVLEATVLTVLVEFRIASQAFLDRIIAVMKGEAPLHDEQQAPASDPAGNGQVVAAADDDDEDDDEAVAVPNLATSST